MGLDHDSEEKGIKRFRKKLGEDIHLLEHEHTDTSAEYIDAYYEDVVPGSSAEKNCYIIMGKDRECGTVTGYGGGPKNGKYHTGTGAIDIVVGLEPVAKIPSPAGGKSLAYCNKNFVKDAARIYLSQKTDIDGYFNIKRHRLPHGESKGVSGIGIKADAVRIIGRQDIKLVTFTDSKTGNNKKDIKSAGGVHLMAGPPGKAIHDSEPLVKGLLLKKFHNDVVIQGMMEILEIIKRLVQRQNKINKTVSEHVHIGFMGACTTQSQRCSLTIPTEMLNSAKETMMDLELTSFFLTNASINWLDQNKYLSQFHTTN